MFYQYNNARTLRGLVIVNSQLKFFNKWYVTEGEKDNRESVSALTIGKRGAQELERLLQLDQIELLYDPTKSEIVEKFKEIEQFAKEHTSKDGQTLGVLCFTIGFNVTAEHNKRLFRLLKVPTDGRSQGMTHHYVVTVDGEPVNVNEYMTKLANIHNVTVLYLLHHDNKMY